VIKGKVQLITIVIGFISFGFFVNTMLQIPTVIIPSWFLVLMYTPVLIGISLTLGYFVKNLRETKWKTISFTFLFITIISLLYVFSQHSRKLRINIPKNYSGAVYLILSNEKTNDFDINQFGIGYICEDTYNSGFTPKVYRQDVDITKTIKSYNRGSASARSISRNSIWYSTFNVPPENVNSSFKPTVYRQDEDITKSIKDYNNENISSLRPNLVPDLEIKIPSRINGEINIHELFNKVIDKERVKQN